MNLLGRFSNALAGTLWTAGVMGAAGFTFNLANTIFMPLVVGAGVEYGVIIIKRWLEGRSGDMDDSLSVRAKG